MKYKIIQRNQQNLNYDFLVTNSNEHYCCPFSSNDLNDIIDSLLNRKYVFIHELTYNSILNKSKLIYESNNLSDFKTLHIIYPELFL